MVKQTANKGAQAARNGRPEAEATVAVAESPAAASAGKHILIADDESSIRSLLRDFLEGEEFQVSEAATGQQVIKALAEGGYDLIMMDIRMPEMDGMAVLKELHSKKLDVPIILMTAHNSATIAIQATQLGAYDYITKPFELQEVLLTINRYFERQQLTSEVRSLRNQLQRDPAERIIGNSTAMQVIYKIIGRAAGTDATILITGETGTGKELVANTIHSNSQYRHGPMIKVNCAALPETLLESELFGHEKGSFTGALTQRKGRFEMAHKGTIFLDEIGEMTLSTQRKLLRVLQEREFERVGGSLPIKVDVRVIAATNKRLKEEVAAGRFRDDLYYRLAVIEVDMPPLRERREDVPFLVEHFLDKHRYSATSAPARISEEALVVLQQYDWPGNVRELENAIERAVVMSQGGIITSHHLLFSPYTERKFLDVTRMVRDKTPLADILSDAERIALLEALDQARGDRSDAAKMLGLSRPEFYAKLKEFDLSS
ncbi:MAG TPA: sigma-54 dependent transcriptional regulator [Chloroflexia bacterium]|nr:sigma-54 dependent transcriptional regulator [Chloroflexia bacterium]